MKLFTLTIEPLSAFGGPVMGDTLFGQLCWGIHNRYGQDRLAELLQGYTENAPFAVVSDAFPTGYLPRPSLPLSYFDKVSDADRKHLKKRVWLPVDEFGHPLQTWLGRCVSAHDVAAEAVVAEYTHRSVLNLSHPQIHNTINRITGTTGTGEFAPYTQTQHWFAVKLTLQIYLCYDADRIGRDEIHQVVEDVGKSGYGRDASIGLGKFRIADMVEDDWPAQGHADAVLTLANCSPQGAGFDPDASYYHPFTRFGRHGDVGVHMGKPFKTPLLLAAAGAIFTPDRIDDKRFVGRGLGGNGQLSKTIPETVHQGYAPVLPVKLPGPRGAEE